MPKGHYLPEKKKKSVNICLGAHLIFHLSPPNPTIFTRIEPLVFKFSIFVFYTSILQGVLSLCHPFSLCYKYVNIVKVKVLWVIHLKLKELSKVTFNFLPVSLFHSLSLLHFFFFFEILVQNLFGIKILRVFLILLEGVPIFFLKVNK